MASYSIARLEEIEELDDGRVPFRAVRQHFGIKTFGITAMTAGAGGANLVNEHLEDEPDSSEELYIVVSGRASFELDGETHDAPAGTLVHVNPGVKRSAKAVDAGTTVLAIGAGPEGQPYEASGWEVFAPLYRLFETGEYELGADRAAALLAEGPVHGPAAYYNTACFESQAGRTELALEHLRQSFAIAPSYRALAREDEDLAPLRDNPEFIAMVASD